MNLKDISTQLLYTTLPLWVEYNNGGQGSATAFIYMVPDRKNPQVSIPFLITNYHVVKDAKRGVVEIVGRNGELPAQENRVRIEISAEHLTAYTDNKNDLAAIPIAPILNQLESSGKPAFFRSISPDLIPTPEKIQEMSAIEDITFIGYPSGLYDKHNATPIIRRGITATPIWNDYEGEQAFLIDAEVFPGSSGSPVFLFNQGAFTQGNNNFVLGNRIFFLGILSESIVRKEQTNVFLGIGKVVKSQCIQTFVESILNQIQT